MNRIVAITGAGSPIGAAASRKLSETHNFDILNIRSIQNLKNDFVANITDPSTASNLFKGLSVETVIHLSHANLDFFDGDTHKYKLLNKQFALNLAESALDSGCKKFVFASSSAVYGDQQAGKIRESSSLNPKTIYAESKAEIEEELLRFSNDSPLDICSLRIFNVYGTGLRNSFINKLAKLISQKSTDQLNMSGPDNFIRDYIHLDDVSDVISAVILSTDTLLPQLNVGTGVATSNQDLLNLLPQELTNHIHIVNSEFSSSVADSSLLKCNYRIEFQRKIEDAFS